MMKRISFQSVLKIDRFSHLNEIGLLPREMDKEVEDVLWTLGLDFQRGLYVQPCKHRDLDGNIQIGYTYMGYERTDGGWLGSKYASLDAHIESNKDSDLKGELYRMSRQGVGKSGFDNMCLRAAGGEGTTSSKEDTVEPDYLATTAYLQTLHQVQVDIRGIAD